LIQVISRDGTQIAFSKLGSGPSVILFDGGLCYRPFGPRSPLAQLLASKFTGITSARRGRGESSNSKPCAVNREIESLEALINETRGSAFLFGTSSGTCLALEAALRLGHTIRKLAMYEAPHDSDPDALLRWKGYRKELADLLTGNRRAEAVALFMMFVGTPADQIEGMRQAPIWPMFEAVAPTLAYDAAVMGEEFSAPLDRAAGLALPTPVLDGGANQKVMPFLHESVPGLAKGIPRAHHRTLEGQTHDVDLKVPGPVVAEFFAS